MALVSQAEFARVMGVDRAYVTQLKHAGRLVMQRNLVDVDASRALIERTTGGRDDVARRHQEARVASEVPQTMEEPSEPAEEAPGPSSAAMNAIRETKASAESRLATANARLREAELEERLRNLVPRAEVEFVLQDLGATLRTMLEGMADRLTPIVLPLQSFEEVHTALADEAETVLKAIADQMKRNAERKAA